jgi:hypothetical protein
MTPPLSDKAIAVFAFAAYHQLGTGVRVSKVVRVDHAGHEADAEAVSELASRGLARVEGDHISFTGEGEALLAKAIEGLRGAISGAG